MNSVPKFSISNPDSQLSFFLEGRGAQVDLIELSQAVDRPVESRRYFKYSYFLK
jgi:hypothetical protein